jgi:hypothetical protein
MRGTYFTYPSIIEFNVMQNIEFHVIERWLLNRCEFKGELQHGRRIRIERAFGAIARASIRLSSRFFCRSDLTSHARPKLRSNCTDQLERACGGRATGQFLNIRVLVRLNQTDTEF